MAPANAAKPTTPTTTPAAIAAVLWSLCSFVASWLADCWAFSFELAAVTVTALPPELVETVWPALLVWVAVELLLLLSVVDAVPTLAFNV